MEPMPPPPSARLAPRRLALAPLLLAALVSDVAWAQSEEVLRERLRDEPFTIAADTIEYEEARELWEFSGDVTIEQPGGRSLRADWLVYNAATRAGVATGNVRIHDGTDTLSADFAAVNLETLEAVASDAELHAAKTGFVGRGSTIRKTGEASYRIERGNFTTCRCPPGSERRPWEVEVGSADVDVGGYATARHVVGRVLGWPVLYVPWVILPVKTERQSGLLIPELALSSRDGFQVELPIFWAARPELNLLLRPRYIEERGLKGSAEYELVFGEFGSSDGGGSIQPDDDEVERDDPETRYSSDRWAYWLRHEQPFAPGARLGADVRRVSDNHYLLDFDDLDASDSRRRFLESRGWLTWAGPGWFAGVDATLFDDLQSPNDLDRDDLLLQRLPEVQLARLPLRIPWLPLRGALSVHYTYFHRLDDRELVSGTGSVGGLFFDTGRDGLFDAGEPDAVGGFPAVDSSEDNARFPGDPDFPEGNLRFEEGELLADHGHRVELHPRLLLPTRLGPLEVLVEGGVRQGLYVSRNLDSKGRTLYTGRADARLRFERTFRLRARRLRHVLEPRVGFALAEARGEENNPFFVPQPSIQPERLADTDLRVVLRDPSDRIPDRRLLTYALESRFFGSAPGEGLPPHQLAELHLGWGYDFERNRVTNAYLASLFEPRADLSIELQLGFDPKEEEVDEALVRAAWSSSRGHRFTADYRFVRDLPLVFEDFPYDDEVFDEFDEGFDRVNQLSVEARFAAHRRLELLAGGYFSFEDSDTKWGRVGLILHSRCACWDLIASLTQRTRPNDTRVEVQLRLAGLGFQGR